MGALTRLIGRTRAEVKRPHLDTFALSTSTTRVFFDIAVDNQPAGRIVFKVYDDIEKWTAPWSTNFIKAAEAGQKDEVDKFTFVGSEFQRVGQGRGEAVSFAPRGKTDVDLYQMRKLWDFMMRDFPYTDNVHPENPLVHDREGLLTAVTNIPERTLRLDDFNRQIISSPVNLYAKNMFGITYDSYLGMDGKFQVIGEIVEGWDSFIEIECACVQPLSYYYPNNQHLIALAEQTGLLDDPEMIERIAMGLQTDSYVPGLIEAQLAMDSGTEGFSEEQTSESSGETSDETRIISEKQKREEMLRDIPIAVRPALESAETAEIKEREKWEAWDKKSQMDFHTMNKFQGYPNIERKNELINNPTIGPGPMTASATITNSGLLGRDRNFISASIKNYLSAGN